MPLSTSRSSFPFHAVLSISETPEYSPAYNIAFSRQVLTIRVEDGKRKAALMRWGLIPHWAKDEKMGYRLIKGDHGFTGSGISMSMPRISRRTAKRPCP